jgi:two-component system chemotaxis response regulator CheB
VLVTDDSVYMRRLIKALLEHYEDFDVIATAENGRDCLALAQRLMPDLITLDMNLPDIDGVDVLRRLREFCRIPVVIVSSLPVDEAPLAEQLAELGAAGAVPKPFGDGAVGLQLFETELLNRLRTAALSIH